jgi:hypothetical protein
MSAPKHPAYAGCGDLLLLPVARGLLSIAVVQVKPGLDQGTSESDALLHLRLLNAVLHKHVYLKLIDRRANISGSRAAQLDPVQDSNTAARYESKKTLKVVHPCICRQT